MRTVLIRPVYETPTYDPEIQEALGLETLTGLMRSEGQDVLLLDPMLSGQSEQTVARLAASHQPDIVGFSAMSDGDLGSISRICNKVDALVPRTPLIIVGGTLPTTQPCQTMRSLPAHCLCVRFEGEKPLLDLLNRLERHMPAEGVPGTVFRDPAGSITEMPSPSPSESLDPLPDAARDFAGLLVEQGRTLNVQGSRGCCGACSYCCAPNFPHLPGKRWRGRSPERIADEVADLNRRFGATAFNFVDDDFLGPPDKAVARAKNLLRALDTRGLRIAFGIQARPDSLLPEATRALAEAGLAYAFVGFENDDPLVLRAWGRNQSSNDTWATVANLRGHGIEVQIGSIMFHPDATTPKIKALATILTQHGALNYRTATNRLHALPGSVIHDRYLHAGDVSRDGFGGFTPPIACRATAKLYESLLTGLLPIRPCWVHGMTLLTHYVTRQRAQDRNGNNAPNPTIEALHAILQEMDQAVGSTLFSLIAVAEQGADPMQEALRMKKQNLAHAETAIRDFAHEGMVASDDWLREVVRHESGL